MQIVRMFCTAALCSISAQAFATSAPSLTPRAFGLFKTLAPTVSSVATSRTTSTRMMSTVAPADFIKTENETNKGT
jgi:hypothetical protein